jgi:hypothetical protein
LLHYQASILEGGGRHGLIWEERGLGTGDGGYFGPADAVSASRLQETSTFDRINGSKALDDLQS